MSQSGVGVTRVNWKDWSNEGVGCHKVVWGVTRVNWKDWSIAGTADSSGECVCEEEVIGVVLNQ